MKKTLLLLAIVVVGSMNAQMKLKLNDKIILENTVIKAEDIKIIEVAFDKYKKLDYYNGKVSLIVEVGAVDGRTTGYFEIKKEGHITIKDFLESANKFFTVPIGESFGNEFSYKYSPAKELIKLLQLCARDSKTAILAIALSYREKIGYEKYGDQIMLADWKRFTIDNTSFYIEAQQKIEEEKAANKLKEEERAKQEAQYNKEREEKATQEKKEADKKEKINSGKKLIKGVFGR